MKIHWLKAIAFEVSYVNRPAIDKRFIAIKMTEYKAIIPFKKTKPLPESTVWDASVEIKKSEAKDLKVMCTWYDSKDAESKGSYKLPHHAGDKGYPVIWNGVKAAMGALMGARGGVILPDPDRKGVYDHLAKHYKQFDKDIPEFKELDELDKSFIDRISNKIKDRLGLVETKVGRVLSKANETKLSTAADDIVKAIEKIQTVLASVEKNIKKEDSEMDKKEVKEIIEEVIDEKLGTFQKTLDEKLDELLSKKSEEDKEEKDEEGEGEEDEDKDKDKDADEESDEDDDNEKDEKDDGEKNLVDKISKKFDEKIDGITSEIKSIKKELKIKPESDKKKDQKKDTDEEKKDDGEVSYTGVFGISKS